MTLQTLITLPKKSYYVTVRIEYLAICDGDDCCAALLNEFEQWAIVRHREIEKAQAHAAEWARPGHVAAPMPDEWVYWTREEIYREMFGLYGESRLDAALKKLMRLGYIERRKKPRDKFDHSYQYRFVVATVQAAIDNPQYQDFDAVISRQRVVKSKHRSGDNTTLKESIPVRKKRKDTPPKRQAARTANLKADPSPSDWQPILTATMEALKFAPDSYAAATKAAQLLSGRVPEKSKSGAANGEWFDNQLERGMDAAEIAEFGAWLKKHYTGSEPIRKAATLNDYAGRFRADSRAKTPTPEKVQAQAEYDEWLHSLPAHDPKWSSYPGLVSHRAN